MMPVDVSGDQESKSTEKRAAPTTPNMDCTAEMRMLLAIRGDNEADESSSLQTQHKSDQRTCHNMTKHGKPKKKKRQTF
jgi:hypothetical protein